MAKKVTIIVEDDDIIETTVFHIAMEIKGSFNYANVSTKLDNGMFVDLPSHELAAFSFQCEAAFNTETGNFYDLTIENKR